MQKIWNATFDGLKLREMNKIFALIIFVMFSSCASIMNENIQTIALKTDKKITVVSVDSSINVVGNSELVYVKRSRNPIKLNLYSRIYFLVYDTSGLVTNVLPPQL